MVNEKKLGQFDENGMIIYNGQIPEDVRLLDSDVNFTAAFFVSLAQTALIGFIGYTLSAVLTKPPTGGKLDSKRGYGFALDNTRAPTTPLAIVYGEHKFNPHVWYNELSTGFNDNILHLMLGIGEGPIDSISEVKVNNILFDNLTGYNNKDIHTGDDFEIDPRLNEIGLSQDFSDIVPENKGNIIRTTANNDVTAMKIGFLFPNGLYRISSQGPEIHSAYLNVDYRKVGDSEWTAMEVIAAPWGTNPTGHLPYDAAPPGLGYIDYTPEIIIRKKQAGEIRLGYYLDRLEAAQYEVRITNNTPSADEFTYIDEIQLDYITEFVDRDFEEIDNFAYMGMTLQATPSVQGSIPEITGLIKGRKIGVLQEVAGEYVETIEWSDNPVWILRDFLTNARYGVGRIFTDDDLDLDSFITTAAWCDELDSNGYRRGQLDLVIDEVQPAVDIITQILKSFGGIMRKDGHKINLIVDKDDPATQAFNMSNIITDSLSFEIAGIDKTTKINRINVNYFNRDRDFIRDIKRIEASDEINNEADVREINVDLPGVTREGCVDAIARRMFNILRTNITTVEFKADISTVQALPGDIVTITHELPGWVNKKFRIYTIEEDENQTRSITAVEHNASVYNESAAVTTAISDTNLWNPLSTGSIIDTITLNQFDRVKSDGTVVQDMLVSWSTVTGTNTIFRIDHFDVYSSIASGTLYPIGTSYNEDDENSIFFVRDDGVLVSGTTYTPFILEGTTKPPTQSYTIRDVSPNDFYHIAVIDVTDNSIQSFPIKLSQIPTATTFIDPYETEPDNISLFSATFTGRTITLSWEPVSLSDVPDLAGYEIRDQATGWGTDDSHLIFRGNATKFTIEDTSVRSKTYYIKSFNTTRIYSDTAISVTASNTAPAAVSILTPVVLGNSISIRWLTSSETDVIGYRIHVGDTEGFTPSTSNLFMEVTGKDTSNVLYSELDDSFPTRYVRVTAIDALSKVVEDYVYSSETSFSGEDNSSIVDQTSINLINDSDFNGILPGFWTVGGNANIVISIGTLGSPSSSLTQTIPNPRRRIGDNIDFVLSIEARSIGTPNDDLRVRFTDNESYNKVLTVSDSEITSSFQRFSENLNSGTVPSTVYVIIETDTLTGSYQVDHIMLQAGQGLTQWVPHAFEIINGYTDWIGSTELSDSAVVTSKLAANAITAEKISSGAIETNHLAADLITSDHISSNTIVASMYQELRQTFVYTFDGDLDTDYPLDVLFQIPSELQNIINVKLTFKTRPFRANSRVLQAGGGAFYSTTPTQISTHTHDLTVVYSSSSSPHYIFNRNGDWLKTNGGWGLQGDASVYTTISDDHYHSWTVNEVSGGVQSTDKIFCRRNSNLGTTNAGFHITTNIANGSGGPHRHRFEIPYVGLSSSIPTTQLVYADGNWLYVSHISGSSTPPGSQPYGGFPGNLPLGSQTITSNSELDGHVHGLTIPDHTHDLDYGIYEESDDATTISLRRSNNGSNYESTNFYSSSSPSVLDLDINPSSFFSGTGFKALRFFSAGANNGRRHIVGHLQVKVDISA